MILIRVVKRTSMSAKVRQKKKKKAPTAFCKRSLQFTERTSWFNWVIDAITCGFPSSEGLLATFLMP